MRPLSGLVPEQVQQPSAGYDLLLEEAAALDSHARWLFPGQYKSKSETKVAVLLPLPFSNCKQGTYANTLLWQPLDSRRLRRVSQLRTCKHSANPLSATESALGASKAVEDYRTPRRFAIRLGRRYFRQVLDCASPLALFFEVHGPNRCSAGRGPPAVGARDLNPV